MLEDPRLDPSVLAAALGSGWGLLARDFAFIAGYDPRSATYAATTEAGERLFAKVRLGRGADIATNVACALADAGVPNVLAPIRTSTSAVWHPMEQGAAMLLYPFVAGRNAVAAPMSSARWREFGATLRVVHDARLPAEIRDALRADEFELPAAAEVRRTLDGAERRSDPSPAHRRLAGFLGDRALAIEAMLVRAAELANGLRGHGLEPVLCHGDVHAANLLVANDGRTLLVDWDEALMAPRERDLLFVVGSRIARDVTPHEEGWFFEGYGEVAIDPEAIVFYRYERILEDIAAIASSVFDDERSSEVARAQEVDLAESFFRSGGIVETVERVDLGATSVGRL